MKHKVQENLYFFIKNVKNVKIPSTLLKTYLNSLMCVWDVSVNQTITTFRSDPECMLTGVHWILAAELFVMSQIPALNFCDECKNSPIASGRAHTSLQSSNTELEGQEKKHTFLVEGGTLKEWRRLLDYGALCFCLCLNWNLQLLLGMWDTVAQTFCNFFLAHSSL